MLVIDWHHPSSGKNRGRSTKSQNASASSRAKSTPSMIGTMKSVVFIADARCAPAQHSSKKPKSLSNKHNRCYVVRHQQAQPKNHSASDSSKMPSSEPKTARIRSWTGYMRTGHVMANHLAIPQVA